MQPEIDSPDISKVYACVFWPVKIPVRTFYKHISLKLMVKFITRRTCFDRPNVYYFGNKVLITER